MKEAIELVNVSPMFEKKRLLTTPIAVVAPAAAPAAPAAPAVVPAVVEPISVP